MRKGATPIDAARTPARPSSSPPQSDVRRSYVKDQYPTLVRNNRLRASDLVRLRDEASRFGHRPLVSVLLPVLDPEREWLESGLDSVLSQVYPAWELCICAGGLTGGHAREVLLRYERLDSRINVRYLEGKRSKSGLLDEALSFARGDFVGLLNGGDELAPDALFEVVKLLQEHPGADLIYSDEGEVDEKGNRSNPYFKPGWSPDLLLSANYVSHLSVYRRSLLEEAGGFREGFDGCQDYDLLLRATERTGEIHHVPKVLYHRRVAAGLSATSFADKSRIRERTRLALTEALERRGLEGHVGNGLLPDRFRVRPKI
ncbi:MAG: glycosyltransferase, partial [Actinomycetota bacterium]|nr:glycosyltransferase [Actinomycetota bacterium]